MKSSMMIFYFYLFTNRIATLDFSLPTTIPAIQQPTETMKLSMPSNIQFGHICIVLHTTTTAKPESLSVTSITISSTLKLMNGHGYRASWSIDYRTGASSTT